MPNDTAVHLARLLNTHRSIRRYKTDPLDPDLIQSVLQNAIAGSSSSGNLNTYSIILTQDPDRKSRLCELHFEQEMIRQAPLLLTFCADTHRTRRWLKLRNARDNFNNLEGFLVAAFDAIILSQSVALAFESHGLGICYLGTTLDACADIATFLELPETTFPVTSMVVGIPDEDPPKRDRLPTKALLHHERYEDPTDDHLLELFAEREVRGWKRYTEGHPELLNEFERHGITSLAQFYTSDLKYSPENALASSQMIRNLLARQGFVGVAGE